MRFRLLVNAGRKFKAGSVVSTADLGADEIERLGGMGFLEVVRGEDETGSPFEVALEAYRLHMEAAGPLTIAALDVTQTDEEVVLLVDVIRGVTEQLPEPAKERFEQIFARAAELAAIELFGAKDPDAASVSTATSAGAVGMEAAPINTASASDQAANAGNPEGGAGATTPVVTTSEAQTVASPDGAAVVAAAPNAQPAEPAPVVEPTPVVEKPAKSVTPKKGAK